MQIPPPPLGLPIPGAHPLPHCLQLPTLTSHSMCAVFFSCHTDALSLTTTTTPPCQAARSTGSQVLSWAEAEAQGSSKPVAPEPPKPSDLSTIMYTSGTTGERAVGQAARPAANQPTSHLALHNLWHYGKQNNTSHSDTTTNPSDTNPALPLSPVRSIRHAKGRDDYSRCARVDHRGMQPIPGVI